MGSGNGAAAMRDIEQLEAHRHGGFGGAEPLNEDVRALFQRARRDRGEQTTVLSQGSFRLSPGLTLIGMGGAAAVFVEPFGAVASELFTPVPLSGPLALFGKLVDRWRLQPSEACSLLGLDATDVFRLHTIRLGLAPLVGRDPMDRLDAVTEIFRSLAGRFGNEPKAEREWLRAPTSDLKDRAPLAVMTEDGMEGLLTVRDYVRWLDGR